MPSSDPLAVRFIRFQQGVIGVAILAGFVFRVDALLPVLAVLTGVAVVAGPRGNVFFFVFDVVIAARLHGESVAEDAGAVRFGMLLVIATLAVATALQAIGLGGLAWVLALALAIAEAVGAVAGISLGRRLFERFRSSGS